MNQIDDERVMFYFRHEALIREWAEIEKDALTFSHQFYLTVKAPLDEALGQSFPGEVESFVGGDPKWPSICLRRPDGWSMADSDPDIRLEWERKDCLLTMDECRWVGIRTNADKYRRPLAEKRPSDYRDDRDWWPAYKYVTPIEGSFWESDGLDKYRSLLVRELVEAWRVLSPLVDRVYQR